MSKMPEGVIYSWTEIKRNSAPADFIKSAPYFVALVKLDDGPMITAMMTDIAVDLKEGKLVEPKIGERVELTTRKMKDGNDERGLIYYGFKARTPIVQATEEQIAEIRGTIQKAMRGIFD